MGVTRAVRRFVKEHVSDLTGKNPQTGRRLTEKEKKNRARIERADKETAGRRGASRRGYVAGVVSGGAFSSIAGLTAKETVDKLTAKTENTDNPVTKAGVRNALSDLGAAYRQSVKDAQSGETSRRTVKALNRTAFERAFAAAAKRGDKTFPFEVNGVMKKFSVVYKKKKQKKP